MTKLSVEAKHILHAVKEAGEELAQAKQDVVNLNYLIDDVLLAISMKTEQDILAYMGSLVTAGVQDIFQEDWKVELRSTSAAQKGLNIFLIKDGQEEQIPDAVGGGVSQVVSLLIRLIVVHLLKGRIRQFVFLDEPLSHLADEYVGRAGDVLANTAQQLGIQIVMITHQRVLEDKADVVYTVNKGKYTTDVHQR